MGSETKEHDANVIRLIQVVKVAIDELDDLRRSVGNNTARVGMVSKVRSKLVTALAAVEPPQEHPMRYLISVMKDTLRTLEEASRLETER